MSARTIDLNELMRRAFVAGFTASREGYNGEYPFNFDEWGIALELHEDSVDAIEAILATIPAPHVETGEE